MKRIFLIFTLLVSLLSCEGQVPGIGRMPTVFKKPSSIVLPNQYISISTNDTLYVSNDNGQNWNKLAYSANGMTGVDMSYDGQYQTIVYTLGTLIYRSVDYGNSFLTSSSYIRYYSDISLSETGQYQLASVSGSSYIYGSSNYGVNWTQKSVTRSSWTSVEICGNGQYQLARRSGDIILSSDFGVTFTTIGFTGNGFSISYDGQFMYVSTIGTTYFSNDYGSSWVDIGIPSNNSKCSLDGSAVVFSNYYNQNELIYSDNYGQNIMAIPLPVIDTQIIDFDINSDASIIYYLNVDGECYYTFDYGSSWIQIFNRPDLNIIGLSNSKY